MPQHFNYSFLNSGALKQLFVPSAHNSLHVRTLVWHRNKRLQQLPATKPLMMRDVIQTTVKSTIFQDPHKLHRVSHSNKDLPVSSIAFFNNSLRNPRYRMFTPIMHFTHEQLWNAYTFAIRPRKSWKSPEFYIWCFTKIIVLNEWLMMIYGGEVLCEGNEAAWE